VFEVVDAAAIAICRDLGQHSTEFAISDVHGRDRMRNELRKAAVDRGATHLRFSEFRDGRMQLETARFYDCTVP